VKFSTCGGQACKTYGKHFDRLSAGFAEPCIEYPCGSKACGLPQDRFFDRIYRMIKILCNRHLQKYNPVNPVNPVKFGFGLSGLGFTIVIIPIAPKSQAGYSSGRSMK
jgi:hypothetical protein